jgi:hypothetical protein
MKNEKNIEKFVNNNFYEKKTKKDKQCHYGPIEIVPNLFCGSEKEILESYQKNCYDVLVPLNSLSGSIWNKGFRGEILYYPTPDFDVLPEEIANELTEKIIERMTYNKKVGLFCLGGHGRTGYIASIVLGKRGIKDPVHFIRKKYCKEAIESNEQINQISKILDLPELIEKYGRNDYFSKYDDYLYGFYDYRNYNKSLVGCFSEKEDSLYTERKQVGNDQNACEDYYTLV